ncbi:MAG: hypothetical protein E7654_01200 [Ruminococcaceae bacterium]|nr:hypothetical protein [Oscillospiraceae bacterium]
MDSFKLCAAAMLITVAAVLVRQYKSEFVFPLRTASGVMLMGCGAVLLTPAMRFLEGLGQRVFAEGQASMLMRALCILLLVRFCAALCRDCGESTVALCLEFAGKAELILLAIPLLQELLADVEAILAW